MEELKRFSNGEWCNSLTRDNLKFSVICLVYKGVNYNGKPFSKSEELKCSKTSVAHRWAQILLQRSPLCS